METFFLLLSEHYPIIAIVLIAIVGICVVVYKITMYHVSIQETRRKVDDLPCDENGKKIDSTARILDALLLKVDNLPCDRHRDAIFNIENTLLSKRQFKPSLSASLSPKKLTEQGYKLYQISGIQTVLENNLQYYIEKIEAFAPKTAWDTNNLAFNVIFNSKDEDFFIPVKDWAFNNPVFNDEDIDMDDICYVASLQLRDAYFEKYPHLLPAPKVNQD